MIKVVAKHKIREDKIDTVLKLYEELVEATNNENGCIKYELYQDESDSSILTMIEEWVDKQTLDVHMNTEHFKKIVPMVGEFVQDSSLNIYHKVF